jgi:hypothetical protein
MHIGAWKSDTETLGCANMRNFDFSLDIFERHTEADKLLFFLIPNGENQINNFNLYMYL